MKITALLFGFCLFGASLVYSEEQVPTPKPAPSPPPAPAYQSSKPKGWPESISTPTGFNDLGKAITKEARFPKNGTPREKARYVASRLPEIASAYNLSAGTGSIISSAVVGIVRKVDDFARLVWGGGDKENAAPLKSSGTGNCGEWSYAFSEILDGARLHNPNPFCN